jgi:tRNA threonylcarbamoyl adenosine modification protein (Sua5/YciO/YrdC/YwlC family)
VTLRIRTSDPAERERGLAAAAAAVRRGQLVGLPLDTTYGLAADAFSAPGTAALRTAKARPDLAIPVMVPRIATVSGIALVEGAARSLMQGFWPGPLTLVLPAQPTLTWSLTDPAGRIAVRMPLHPVALELLARTGPLGVVGAAPGATDPDAAFADGLAEHVAVLLDAGPVPGGAASAVVDLTGPVPVLVRPGPLDPAELIAACPGMVVPDGPVGEPAT